MNPKLNTYQEYGTFIKGLVTELNCGIQCTKPDKNGLHYQQV